MANDPIQLTPFDQVNQDTVSLDPGSYNPVSPEAAESLATKADFGLSKVLGKSKDDMKNQIQTGGEQNLRSQAAFKLDMINDNARRQALTSYLNSGQPVTQESIQPFMTPSKTDPSTVFENSFANNYTYPLANRNDPWAKDTMGDAHEQMPEIVDSAQQLASRLVAKDQYYGTKMQEISDTLKGQSWLGWGWDQIKTSFQPYNEFKLRGWTDQANSFANVLLGEDLKAQADDINRLPLDQAREKVDGIIGSLMKDNPSLAYKFMSYLMSSNDNDRHWDDFWTGAMGAGAISGIAGKLRLLGKITRAYQDVTEAAKEVRKPASFSSEDVKDYVSDIDRFENEGGAIPPDVSQPASTGDLRTAAVNKITQDVVENESGKANVVKRAFEALPTAMKEDMRLRRQSSGNRGQDLVNRIEEDDRTLMQKVFDAFGGMLRIDRLADITKSKQAVNKVLDYYKAKFPELADHVMNARGLYHDPVANNWYVDLILGRDSGTPFKDENEARGLATFRGITLNREELAPLKKMGSFRIFANRERKEVFGTGRLETDGSGVYIARTVPVKEDEPIIRQLYGLTEHSKSPWSMVRAFTSWISTGEDTQSFDLRAAKQIATYGPDKLYDIMKGSTQKLRKLTRSQANDMERFLMSAMKKPDPANEGVRGVTYRGIGEMEDAFQRELGRLPEDQEVEAYYEFVRNLEMDRWFRIAAKIRLKTRVGAEFHVISTKGPEGKEVDVPGFEGVRLNQLPIGDKYVTAIFKDKLDHMKLYSSDKIPTETREELDEKIKNGQAQVYEIFDPDEHPLKGFGGIEEQHRVRYVVAYRVKSSPLNWETQVPRRGGGHILQEHEGYLSQAKVNWNPLTKRFLYNGDLNLHGVDVPKMGKDLAIKYNKLQEFKRNDDLQGAKNYVQNNHIPIPLDEFWSDFDPKKGPNGEVVPARFSKTEPFMYRPKDKNIMDLNKEALVDRYTKDGKNFLIDGTRQGSLARTATVMYTGERDAYDFYGIQDAGTKYNPIYRIEQSKLVDAIPMMNRALGQIINSHFMDDYRSASMEHWLFGANVPITDPVTGETKLVGAASFMKASRSEIEHSPPYFFNNPEWAPGTPMEVKSAFMADRMKIRMFTGTPSKIDTALHSLEQKMADSIYGKFGPKAMKLSPLWSVSSLSNVPRIMRSILYNSKMGFFSPRQFLIHAFTFFNAAMISPRYAGTGAMAAMFHGWSYLHAGEDFLKHMDEVASKFSIPGQSSWKPGQWMEARRALLRSNFQKVEQSQLALVDNPMANRMIKNKTEQFLDAGTSPFRAGVKSLKTASWYTAAKEFMDANPEVVKLSDHDISSILVRANDLSHNMSRASTSALQKGVMTFGAMFSSYNLRLAELLIGKRLSGPERARLFFGYMAMFGVPTAGGIFGLSTLLRSQVDKGNVPGLETYVPGYDFPTTAIMEGLLPATLSELTGHVYDFGESYGAKDLDIVDASLNGDKTIWDFFGGAAYSTFGNTWAATSPFRRSMMDMIKGEGQFKVTSDDWVNLFKEISTVNYIDRAYMGVEYGRWMSRNEAYLQPTSPQNALFMSITGLSDQAVPDIYTHSLNIKERQAAQAQAFRQFSREFQRYLRATNDNNQGQADQFAKNAKVYLELIPMQERSRAITQAYRDNQDLISRTDFTRAYGRQVPDADRQRELDIYQKKQEMKARTNG